MGFALFHYFLSVRTLNVLSSTVEDPAVYVASPGFMGMQKYYLEIVFYFELVESLAIPIKNQKLVIEMHSTCA